MSTQRKHESAECKARVAVDAVKGLKTVNEWARTYGGHPTQITHWQPQRHKEVPDIFSARRAKRQHDQEAFQAPLSQQIGPLKVALDWLKKKLDLPPEAKRALIEAAHPQISMARQCDLVGLPRATSSSHTQGESAAHLPLMRWLEHPYTDTPYYGIRRMTAWVRSQGDAVHHKRVARRLQTMGWETRYPKPRISAPHPAHRVYPDWLRGVPITRVKQVWSTDIPSLRLHGGCISLVAVMDWFSRSGRSWAVSITMDVRFCLEAFAHALEGAQPAMCNTDQGAQCTRNDLTGRLAAAGMRRSMDGRGRALEHVFVERLWRPVQYEAVSVKDDETPREAMQGFATFFVRDNAWRQHQSLDYRTPAAVYCHSSA